MFEAITKKPKRRSSTMAIIVSVSVAVHAAVAVGLIVAGMWQVERLEPPHRQLTIGMEVPRPGPKAEKPSVPRVIPIAAKRQAPKLEVLTQPTDKNRDTEPAPHVGYGAVQDEGHTGSRGTGFPGPGTGNLFPGDGRAVPVIEVPPLPPIVEVIETRPPVIRARVLEGKRVAGNAQIRPPESVRAAMFRSESRRIQGIVKMCLNENGKVASLRMLTSTKYPAYDHKILSEMNQWRYRPYRVNGQGMAVCTTVTFVFVMTD